MITPPASTQPQTNGLAIPFKKDLDGESQYDAFISYSTKIDYLKARKLEAFIESFHRDFKQPGVTIRPLQLCRDGSDFKLRRNRENTPLDKNDEIWDVIRSELSKSKYLIVMCSSGAVNSTWVSKEISWMLQHRGAEAVLPVVTEGFDPSGSPKECFPKELITAGLHRNIVWYDLRGLEKPSRFVVTCGYDPFSIRAERRTCYRFFMSREG